MGFTFSDYSLKIEVDGKEYIGQIDSPEALSCWTELKGVDLTSIPDTTDAMREIINLTVKMTTAIFGVDACREIFNGEVVSVVGCTAFLKYLLHETMEQGVFEKMQELTATYNVNEII